MIKAGGKLCLLHHIFQKTGMTPDEFYSKPRGVQAFMLASTAIALEPPGKGAGNGGDNPD